MKAITINKEVQFDQQFFDILNEPRLLKVREVAWLLNVSPKTIYDWAYKAIIPCVRVNGCLRFNSKEIEEWMWKRSGNGNHEI